MSIERSHCDRCHWDGEAPARREWVGEGCRGVVWTRPVCPECGAEVSQTVILEGLKPGPVEGENPTAESGVHQPC